MTLDRVRKLVSPALHPAAEAIRRRRYPGSATFWERRYRVGGISGPGSYGKFAEFKAEVLNDFVATNDVGSLIEFGCGDGNQLSLARYPRYVGLDVSPSAIRKCADMFRDDSSKQFFVYPSDTVTPGTPPFLCDLALSIDVIFHLTEDAVFEKYMEDLFASATRFVVIYSSDSDERPNLLKSPHIKHRPVRRYISERFGHWELAGTQENRFPWNGDPNTTSWADFLFYRSKAAGGEAG